MQTPTIHLNGSSRSSLMEQYGDSWHAVKDAIKVLSQNAPHARDFYVNGPDAFAIAQEEHIARVRALVKVSEDLYAIMLALS